jgi:hypothetical protein
MDSPSFAPGERLIYPDLGVGVVIDVCAHSSAAANAVFLRLSMARGESFCRSNPTGLFLALDLFHKALDVPQKRRQLSPLGHHLD